MGAIYFGNNQKVSRGYDSEEYGPWVIGLLATG